MILNLVGPFIVNAPFGTEIAFSKGLRQIGHAVHEIDPNIDREMVGLQNTADATVVFKSCVGAEKYLRSLKHPIIVYQPDDARFSHIREMMVMMKTYADYMLSFDQFGTDVARMMGYKAAETLLLTADPDLYCPSPEPVERDIDVSFIGSLGDPIAHASRRAMCHYVQAESDLRGWKTVFTQCQDIPTVLDVYRRSKVVINHATDVGQSFGHGFGIQCRHFEVGMTRTAFLSNQLMDRSPFEFPTYYDRDSLIAQISSIVSSKNAWEAVADDLYGEIMTNHTPLVRSIQLVDFIERVS